MLHYFDEFVVTLKMCDIFIFSLIYYFIQSNAKYLAKNPSVPKQYSIKKIALHI